jgi:hypothetical protein
MSIENDIIPNVDEQGERIQLPPIEDAALFVAKELELPPPLVGGLLHLGSKMVIGGGSKSFKTYALLDLAISVATGQDWWGRKTLPGPVLFINLEIQPPFIRGRLDAILGAKGVTLKPGELDIWNLRGHAADFSTLKPEILSRIKDRCYVLIVLDPIYKCYGDREENKTEDMADLMNELERLVVQSGAAVAFGTHFSKGNQAAKESIDRISGSGVFARDPDSILIMTRHQEEDAFTIEATLRNFPPLPPFCVRWQYPLMKPAEELKPEDLKQPGGRSAKVPTEEEFAAIFVPDWPPNNPRFALLSNSQLADEFRLRKYDKSSLVLCRDRAESKGLIGVVRGLPRNEVLAGPPKAVEEYKRVMPQPKEKPARAKRGRGK